MGKSPIDRFREGGGKAEVPPGCGNIVAIFSCERQARMYMLCESCISSGVMADQIDPERINPALPGIVQRIELGFGATTEFIRQTVGMAMALLRDGTHAPADFDTEAAFLKALSVAQDLGEISDTISELSQSEVAVRERLAHGKIEMGKLPKTQNLRGRGNQAIGHLASVRTATVGLAQMFYPKKPNEGWSQALKGELEGKFDEDDWKQLDQVIDYLRSVVDWRNALEHPKVGQRVTFLDYELTAQGMLFAPTIEIEHAASPVIREDLVAFLKRSLESLGNAYESLVSACIGQNVRQLSGSLTTRLTMLPDGEEQRGSRYIWQSEWNEGFPKAIPREAG